MIMYVYSYLYHKPFRIFASLLYHMYYLSRKRQRLFSYEKRTHFEEKENVLFFYNAIVTTLLVIIVYTVLAVPCLVCIWLLDFKAKSISDEMQRQCTRLISLHLTIKLGIIIQLGSCNILTGETNADTGHIGSFNVAQPM